MDAAIVQLNQTQMQGPSDITTKALLSIANKNPGTRWVKAETSKVPGLIKLTADNGKIAYTDVTGSYLILGIVFDASTGEILDGQGKASTQ